MIASITVANQMGIYGASTVTGWGKKAGIAARKWTAGRGWKYAGRATEALGRMPVARQIIGRLPPLRAGAAAVMKKGAGVEKKDVEFYTKLPDRQLSTMLRSMSPTLRTTIAGQQGEKLRKRARKSEDLQKLYRELNWPEPAQSREEFREELDELNERLSGVEEKQPTS